MAGGVTRLVRTEFEPVGNGLDRSENTDCTNGKTEWSRPFPTVAIRNSRLTGGATPSPTGCLFYLTVFKRIFKHNSNEFIP